MARADDDGIVCGIHNESLLTNHARLPTPLEFGRRINFNVLEAAQGQ
jgi:hypothetical protein